MIKEKRIERIDIKMALKDKNVTSSDKRLKRMAVAGVFAALITIMTAYICHIPVPATGGYIHFGDGLIYIVACILPKPYAMLAAAIGGGVADLLTAPMWVLPTIFWAAEVATTVCPRNRASTLWWQLIGQPAARVACIA